MTIHRELVYKLLSVCQEAAPNGDSQRAFTAISNEAREAGDDDGDIAKKLAMALLDGLQYGNWPRLEDHV